MGVFLRWGIFGILAVAALLYAFNANKRLAERHPPRVVQVVSPDRDATEDESVQEEPAEDASTPGAEPELGEFDEVPRWPAVCQEELQVAERALKMRRDGEPLDRLLRIDRILFQPDELRRQRLAAVARHWFEREGRDPNAATLRDEVLRECQRARQPATTAAP